MTGQATWDDVVRAVVAMVESEVEHHQAAKRKTALRKDVLEALKNTIKLVEQRGPRMFLSVKDLTQHFVKMLCQGEEQQPFIKEYSDLLCDYILPVPSYCQLASASFFEELLGLYGEYLLSTPSSTIEHQIYARTFHSLLTHYPMELTPLFSKLDSFFTKYFSQRMEDNKPSALLLSALNYLLQTCAMDEGARVRQLGHELHDVLIKRWDTRQQILKEQIVNFFRLQLLLHTSFTGKLLSTQKPGESHKGSGLNYGLDYLDTLFDLVSKDIEKSGGQTYQLLSSNRMRQSRFNEEDPLFLEEKWRSFLEFAADVFLHMSNRRAVLAMQSATSTESPSSEDLKRKKQSLEVDDIKIEAVTQPRKRRKYTDAFEVLMSVLPLPSGSTTTTTSVSGSDQVGFEFSETTRRSSINVKALDDFGTSSPSLLAWLQLLAVMISKHPYLLPPRYHLHCVESLSWIIKSELSDKPEIEAWSLAVLIGLVKTTQNAIGTDSMNLRLSDTVQPLERLPLKKTESQRKLVEKDIVSKLWSTVWELLVHKISHYNSGSAELALILMKEILENDVADAKVVRDSQEELWKSSLLNDSTKCSIAAIEFLVTFLRLHEIKDIAAAEWNISEAARGLKKRRNGDPDGKDTHGLTTQRELLLEWLLLSLNRDTSNLRLSKNMQKSISPDLIVSAIIALIRPGPPAILGLSVCGDMKDRITGASHDKSNEFAPYRRSIIASSLDFSTHRQAPHTLSAFDAENLDTMKLTETDQAEQRLRLVYQSRKLYFSSDIKNRGASRNRVTTAKSTSNKNQISIALRLRLQNYCVELLRNRAEELLSLGHSLFDSAQKVKTMGLDKHKLMLVLAEMCCLSQVIVTLLPLLLSSPASSTTKGDHSLLAVDIDRVMTLAQDSLSGLLDFLTGNVPLLVTHPQLLKEFLLRFNYLINAWAHYVDHRSLSPDNNINANPISPYNKLLHPLATFLIEYLKDFCLSLQKQSKESQALLATTSSYTRSDAADLDLMEETPVVQSPSRGGRTKREADIGSSGSRSSSDSSVGEMANSADDDCVLYSTRAIVKMATSQLCPFFESTGEVLTQLLKLTHKVDFKFELATHLLDMCLTKSAKFNGQNEVNTSNEDSIYPPTVSLEDSMLSSTSNSHSLIGDNVKASYAKNVLSCVRRLSAQPDSFGRSSVRCRMLRILSRVMALLNHRIINEEDERLPIIQSCTKILKTFVALCDASKLNWPTRIALAELTREFLNMKEEDGEDFSEVIIKLIQDPCFHVRKYISGAITLFFSLYSNQVQIFNDLSPQLLPISQFHSEEEQVTALLTLGEIACVSSENEQRILFELCVMSSMMKHDRRKNKSNPTLSKKDIKGKEKGEIVEDSQAEDQLNHHEEMADLVSFIIEHIAETLAYDSRQSLLADHLSYLLGRWCEAKFSLDIFPINLLNKINFTDFLRHYAEILLPKLVYLTDRENIELVAHHLDLTPGKLVLQHYPAIFAQIFPLYYAATKEKIDLGKYIGDAFLPTYMSAETINKIIPQELDTILIKLFDLTEFHFDTEESSAEEKPRRDEEDENDLHLSAETVKKVLLHLAKGFKMESEVTLFFKTKDRVQKILLYLNQRLATSHRKQAQLRAFFVLRLLMEILESRACEASVLRDLIHTILRTINNPNLATLSCDLLKQLVVLVLENNAKRLGIHLKAIITALIPLAQKSGKPEQRGALSLLTFLMKQAQLKDAIIHLNPFPDISLFADINRIYYRLRGDYTLTEEIQRFIRMGAGAGTGSLAHKVAASSAISVATKIASLSHLKKLLKTSKTDLNRLIQTPAPFQSNHDNGAQSQDTRHSLIDRLIWELVQLCGPQNDSAIHQMAGECLGELGAVDPYAIAFSFPLDSAVHAIGLDSATRKQQMKFAKISIVELLNSYLTDTDVKVLEMAANCLKAVLCTNSGNSAYSTLSDEVKEELMPYRPSSKNAKPPIVVNTPVPDVSLATPDLWCPQSYNSYNEWVSNVTYALAKYAVKDRVLNLCAPMCIKKPEFAEFLFPFAVMDTIYNPDDFTVTLTSASSGSATTMSTAAYISYNFRTYILNDSNSNTESIQLALYTLNILRKQFMFQMGDEENETTEITKKRGTSQIFKSPPEKKGKSSPRFWQADLWKDFNFLDIARAAQRCSAYLTSLLYIELWCEREFGQLQLPPDNSLSSLLETQQSFGRASAGTAREDNCFGSRDESPPHVQLLLEIYSKINEPDSIYGLQRNQSIDSRIKIYEHEKDWSKTLGAYDMTLQYAGNSPPLLLCQGLLSSLQNLGHHHLLEVYLRGFAVQYPTSFLDVAEFQYAEAWRTCKWQMDWFRSSVSPLLFARQSEEIGQEQTSSTASVSHFHTGAYHCLRSLYDGDQSVFWKNLRKTRLELVRSIGVTSLESTKSVYPALAKLQFLGEMENAWGLRWEDPQTSTPIPTVRTKRIPSNQEISGLISSWRERLSLMKDNFELIEPLLSLGTVLLKIFEKDEYLPMQLLTFAKLARKAQCFQIASNCLHQLKHVSHQDGTSHLLWRLEEARVLWDQGEGEKAINIGMQLSRSLQELHNKVIESTSHKGKSRSRPASLDERLLWVYAEATYSTGKWLAETRSESSSTIIEDYLEKTVALCQLMEDENRCRAYFTLARYADGLYGHLAEKLKSSEWATSQELRKQKERELQQCHKLLKTRPKDKDLQRHTIILERQCEIDKSENKRLERERDALLHSAVENYLRCLLSGDKYDIRVMFRLCSLWFNNSADPSVNFKLHRALEEGLPSRKFVPLIYQIASRIQGMPADIKKGTSGTSKKKGMAKSVEKIAKYVGRNKAAKIKMKQDADEEEEKEDDAEDEDKGSANFQEVLNLVIETIALDHPHHSLWQIFALSNGDRVTTAQKGKNRYLVENDKAIAAKNLIDRLRETKHRQLIQEMEKLIGAYIELAFLDVNAYKGETKPIPLVGSVKNIRNLSLIPVPTINIDVSADANYQGTVTISKFDESFSLAGGLNLPKIIQCIGSDGNYYKQLVKGSDDLRQDAVMQQMFLMVNTLLRENPETRKRRLRVRTYKVIPLTPCAGLLEWVQNTIPLGQYLIGTARDHKSGAHERYRPEDILSTECRKQMQEAATTKKRRKVFDSILERFKPVFHHFFLEQFPDPALWFERRLSYIRSVASSSILGYVVGLGDRHAQNILIDKATAEVVHIDLGVAFEQGKTLRTPEVVPFRLTRDIVDGMGITGCEGVFRRCCEETMQVLRASHEFLLTIMEVFIHDPLFKWALSPVKALQLQRDDNEQNEGLEEVGAPDAESGVAPMTGGNKDAERALLRLKAKLQGYEYGQALSVEGQVKQLIVEAQDPSRLAEMFPGWAAWL